MEFIYENERIYAEDSSGKVIAEVTFPLIDGAYTIDHTFVDDSLRGQGVAGKLVKAAADKIISDGGQIKATCSYAVKWFENHSEYNVKTDDIPLSCSINGKH